MSWERAFFVVSCLQCGQLGTAMWEQNDGASFLRDPCTAISVSEGFSQQAAGPLGCEPFFDRVLVCRTCHGPACAHEVSPWPQHRRGDHRVWLEQRG
jgi:hypothetical protein